MGTKHTQDRPGPLTALDLFSGAGGFTLGFEAAGFESVGAIDIDEVAGRSYVANFGDRPVQLFGEAGDMRTVSPRGVASTLRRAGIRELDVLIAAPPCQGFSRIGRGKLDSLACAEGAHQVDPRNDLYLNAIAMLRSLRPRAFVFENVSGILHMGGQNVAERVCNAAWRAGYTVKAGLLNSAWYGVPQSRERVFVIGYRADLALTPTFPRRLHHVRLTRGHLSEAAMNPDLWSNPDFFVAFTGIKERARRSPAITVREAFADLPPFTAHLRALRTGKKYRPRRETEEPLPYRGSPPNAFCALMRRWPGIPASRQVTDHYCRWTPRDFETFARMRPGDRYIQALAIARSRYAEAVAHACNGSAPRLRRADFIPPYPADVFDEKWRKLDPDEPSHTVTAHLSKDTYSHIHFSSREKRAITVREAARLQSFPDSFVLAGNMGDAFQQIGNAVPPILARAVAKQVRQTLAQRGRGR